MPRRLRRLLATVMLLGFAAPAMAEDQPAAAPEIPALEKSEVQPETVTSCRPAEFRAAEVAPPSGTRWDTRLKVTYVVPDPIGQPVLIPLVYVKAPDYWQINFQLCAKFDGTVGIVSVTPALDSPPLPGSEFVAEFHLGGAIGLKGVDLVGSSSLMRKRFELAP